MCNSILIDTVLILKVNWFVIVHSVFECLVYFETTLHLFPVYMLEFFSLDLCYVVYQ